MSQQLVSVIIPAYNHQRFIEASIRSVIEQDYKNIELVIINDGSTDKSLLKVNDLKDSRIQIFSIKNHGVSHARNYGIKKANSQYICFLDADDFWYENHLSELKLLLESYPNCGMFTTAYNRKKNNKILIV